MRSALCRSRRRTPGAHVIQVLVGGYPLVNPAIDGGAGSRVSGFQRLMFLRGNGDLLAEVLLVGLLKRRKLDQVAEALSAHVLAHVQHDSVPVMSGNDLNPPDSRSVSVACPPEKLLDRAPMAQGCNGIGFAQIAHTMRVDKTGVRALRMPCKCRWPLTLTFEAS